MRAHTSILVLLFSAIITAGGQSLRDLAKQQGGEGLSDRAPSSGETTPAPADSNAWRRHADNSSAPWRPFEGGRPSFVDDGQCVPRVRIVQGWRGRDCARCQSESRAHDLAVVRVALSRIANLGNQEQETPCGANELPPR